MLLQAILQLPDTDTEDHDRMAAWSYKLAEAMLVARVNGSSVTEGVCSRCGQAVPDAE